MSHIHFYLFLYGLDLLLGTWITKIHQTNLEKFQIITTILPLEPSIGLYTIYGMN